MPSGSGYQFVLNKCKPRTPENPDEDRSGLPKASATPPDPSVPRYLPSVSDRLLSRSSSSNLCLDNRDFHPSNYQLSSTNHSLGRRGNPFHSAPEDSLAKLRATALVVEDDQVSVPPKASPPDPPNSHGSRAALENDNRNGTFQATWETLVSLFECFRVDLTSSVDLLPPVKSSAGSMRQATGESADSNRSARNSRRQGARAWPHNNTNHNSRSPADDNNGSPSEKQGGDHIENTQSSEGEVQAPGRLFACPFYKSDPVRYAGCHHAKFKDIDSVLRHHVRKTHDQKGHITPAMFKRLGNIKRQKSESKWKAIYSALFDVNAFDVCPYWTAARQNCDIEDNIICAVETIVRGERSWDQYFEAWDSLVERNFNLECEQALKRHEIMTTEGRERLGQRLSQQILSQNSHSYATNVLGVASPRLPYTLGPNGFHGPRSSSSSVSAENGQSAVFLAPLDFHDESLLVSDGAGHQLSFPNWAPLGNAQGFVVEHPEPVEQIMQDPPQVLDLL